MKEKIIIKMTFALWLLLIISCCLAYDFKGDIEVEGYTGTLIHFEDPVTHAVSERFYIELPVQETILRQFDQTVNDTSLTFSSQMFQIGLWNPPFSQCCRHEPIDSSLLRTYQSSDVFDGMTLLLTRQGQIWNVTVTHIQLSGDNIPNLGEEAVDGFDSVREKCPLYCANPMNLLLVLDFSGSISNSQFTQFRLFVEKVLNRFKIDNDSAAIGLESFGGYQQNLVNDRFAFPITNQTLMASLWSDALTNPHWYRSIDWVNHGPNAADYTTLLAPLQTGTGGYASLEVPILTNGSLVRSVAPNLNNARASQSLGFTAIGTAMRLGAEIFKRVPVQRSVPNIMLVMTDGENNRGESIHTAAPGVRSEGIITYGLGIGNQVNFGSLQTIAGNVNRTFMINTFGEMENFLDVLVASTCQASGSISSTDTCQEIPPVVNEPPTGSMTIIPTVGIVPQVVNVSVEASDIDGTIIDITIHWGDNTTSQTSHGSHTYSVDGVYNITVVITDNLGGQLVLSQNVTMFPNQLPIVDVTITPTTGIAPETITLNYTASDPDGSITDINIDWGDGSGPTQNQQHTYTSPGNYTITLTVVDDKGGVTVVETPIEIVANQLPVIMVTIVPTSGNAPLTIEVNATNSYDPDGTIQTYIIRWGDNTTFTTPHGIHTYTQPGVYTVNVTIVDDKGCHSVVTQDIEVNGLPTGSVVIIPSGGIAPQNVSVNVTTSDPDGHVQNITIIWGDGNSTVIVGSSGDEQHTYTQPGTYNLTVIIRDDNGGEKVIVNTVTVQPNKLPVLIYTVNPKKGPAPLVVNVDASGSYDPDGTIVDTIIDWGDSTQSSNSQATHQYASGGNYTVTVSIVDDKGGRSNGTQLIEVNERPIVYAIVDPSTGIAPLVVQVNATNSYDPDGQIETILIEWGDGTSNVGPVASHTYPIPGNYTIRVIATDLKGDSGDELFPISVVGNSLPQLIAVVDPVSGISPLRVSVNTSGSVDLDGTIVSTVIDWGLGSSSPGPIAAYTYPKGGDYLITITIRDDKGGVDSATFPIFVNDAPVVSMTVNPVFGIAPLQVEVDASNSIDPDGFIVSTEINWGDGTFDQLDAANHTYNASGTFTISVIVTDNENASTTLAQSIRILPNQLPVVFLQATPSAGSIPLTVVADGAGTKDVDGEITSAVLNWGDGSAPEDFDVNAPSSHIYPQLGHFMISLTVTDDKGGVTTRMANVTTNQNSNPKLKFKITPPGGLVPLPVELDATESTDPDKDILTLTVDWGDATAPDVGGDLKMNHVYNATGNYLVFVTLEDAKGLKDTGSQIVPVVIGTGADCEDPNGCENPDQDDEVECEFRDADHSLHSSSNHHNGTLVCSPIRISGFCVNRFSGFAAFRYYNALNRTIEIPIGDNNRLTPGGNAPTTVFKPLVTEWFWVDWNGNYLEWKVVEPLSGLHSIGRVDSNARPCIGSENPAALWGPGPAKQCGSSNHLTHIY